MPFPQHEAQACPVFFSNASLDFFRIGLQSGEKNFGSVIVGPAIRSEMVKEQVIRDIQQAKGYANQVGLIAYYQSVSVVSSDQLLALSQMLYYMIYRKRLDKTFVMQHNQTFKTTDFRLEKPELALSEARRDVIFHSNLLYERVLLDYVKHGRVEKLKEVIDYSVIGEAELGILSKNSRLRSEKNLMITGIALVCRAAIEGGLNQETALTLSDFYIQQIEELTHLNEILQLMEAAIFDFTRRVHQLNEQKYSAAIVACQHYIDNHLYGEITLERLADVCHLSASYLSTLFKKEVGTPISEYIQRQKIDEAKKLLAFTDYAISEIAAWLNFNDQSYFIKVFKKYEGITPKHFRNNHLVQIENEEEDL